MKLRVLLVFDRESSRGYGESGVTDLADAIDRAGHEVELFSGRHHDPARFGRGLRLAQPFWWLETLDAVRASVKACRPAIIHMLDWNPQISPSVFRVARQFGIPLVQSVPDFQLHCLKGTYFRNDQRCERCLGRTRLHGVVRRCKSESLTGSVGLAATLAINDLIGNFSRTVTLYLAPTYYARQKLIDGGLPREKVIVRAPFVDIRLPDDVPRANGLFVGPLNAESGFVTLMRATMELAGVQIDVTGYGDDAVIAEHIPAIHLTGRIDDDALAERMARSRFLIHPAPTYTGFPGVIIKAFGARLPVIASAIGGIDEIVEDGRTGLLFEPGSAKELAHKIAWANAHPDAMAEMGRNARRSYEERFSSMRGARQLVDAYDLARQLARGPNFETEEIKVGETK